MKLFETGIEISAGQVATLMDSLCAQEGERLTDVQVIEHWAMHSILAKIENCEKRLVRERGHILTDDALVTEIPADPEGHRLAIMAHQDYRNRAQREAELRVS